MKSLLQDLQWPNLDAELGTDSSAAKGMASRRGAARVRHIHCPSLWLQQAIAGRRLRITKKAGVMLSPDVGTKAGINSEKVWELLSTFNVQRISGRADTQLDVARRA